MINEIKGDLLTAKGYILHGVNCQGVMGSGVAKAIREKWPVVYDQYRSHWGARGGAAYADSLLGTNVLVWVELETVCVVNCFTQDRYGQDGKKYASYDALDRCMRTLSEFTARYSMPTVNFPLIGCGLGGLHWPVVREIIEHRLPDPIIKNLWILKP